MLTIVCVLVASVVLAPQGADRWEKDIKAFEARDRESPPPRQGIVFVGSSSIRLWKVAEAFPDLPVINRGFGGSHMAHAANFAERIVTTYEPKVVVVFAGGNDIAAGKSPEEVRDDFQTLVAKIHEKLPRTKVYFISLYPSPRRWELDDKLRRVNQLIEAVVKMDERLGYIDTRTAMTAADGGPWPELLRDDKLHMNDKGYAIWNEIVGPVLRSAFKDAKGDKPPAAPNRP